MGSLLGNSTPVVEQTDADQVASDTASPPADGRWWWPFNRADDAELNERESLSAVASPSSKQRVAAPRAAPLSPPARGDTSSDSGGRWFGFLSRRNEPREHVLRAEKPAATTASTPKSRRFPFFGLGRKSNDSVTSASDAEPIVVAQVPAIPARSEPAGDTTTQEQVEGISTYFDNVQAKPSQQPSMRR
jgi:hypothetical protein